MYIQNKSGRFGQVNIPLNKRSRVGKWKNVRVGHVTGLLKPDLIVVEQAPGNGSPLLRIFPPRPYPPFFAFYFPYLTMKLPAAATDVEIIDVNNDGKMDIYIPQTNERGGYCAARGRNVFKFHGNSVNPPDRWAPPINNGGGDILLVGRRRDVDRRAYFNKIKLKFPFRGCTGMVRKFGERALIVARGNFMHSGYNYLLDWGPTKNRVQPDMAENEKATAIENEKQDKKDKQTKSQTAQPNTDAVQQTFAEYNFTTSSSLTGLNSTNILSKMVENPKQTAAKKKEKKQKKKTKQPKKMKQKKLPTPAPSKSDALQQAFVDSNSTNSSSLMGLNSTNILSKTVENPKQTATKKKDKKQQKKMKQPKKTKQKKPPTLAPPKTDALQQGLFVEPNSTNSSSGADE